MKLSELRTIRDMVGAYDFREALENIANDENDFEVANHRFIAADAIDEIMQEELKSDTYVLGCFNADFLARVTGFPRELIEAAQKGEAFEALGEALLEHIEEIQDAYASADGYGHHFNHWDGSTEEIGAYYVFRIN